MGPARILNNSHIVRAYVLGRPAYRSTSHTLAIRPTPTADRAKKKPGHRCPGLVSSSGDLRPRGDWGYYISDR